MALSLPIKLDNNRWIDLTLVKAITDEELEDNVEIVERSGCVCIGTLLEKKLLYEFYENNKSEAIVLAVTSYPYMRYGHWYSDLESRGLYVPNCNINGGKLTGKTDGGHFCYSINEIDIGYSTFWYSNWEPIYPKGIRSLTGTLTIVEKNSYPKWLQFKEENKQLFVCTATILISSESYREFESETYEFTVSMDG